MKTVLITGDRSGSGKTTVSLAISNILSQNSTVQTYKVAMDYIDPSYLSGITGRPSYNLDTFVQNTSETTNLFNYGTTGADYGIVEGVRGLYEGVSPFDDVGSTASIAKLFDLPTILVINTRSITRSAAALVKGFIDFDPGVKIKGVILNNVMGKKHIQKATEAIEHYCKIPVVGAIPRQSNLELQSINMGLIPYQETYNKREFQNTINIITDTIRDSIDIDKIIHIMREYPESQTKIIPDTYKITNQTYGKTIAIAYDEAFNFYYGELKAILELMGTKIVYFSPIKDKLPDADGYIFGSGHIELFADDLESNENMRSEIREIAKNNTPIYAECGGLMYLTRSITVDSTTSLKHNNTKSRCYDMCGVFNGDSKIESKKTLGYVIGTAKLPNNWNFSFKGHEFHYSQIKMDSDMVYTYQLSRGNGIDNGLDGAYIYNTLGAYTHLMPISSYSLYKHLFLS
ncbi:MAG TPA: Ni-sirohydrochlorin a,c-diamide synthase [Methanocorpusculum sp.]|nr:Ni-sirohydrochlorin a,c-diamide synthase [Methanocorpusculum sp.]